MKKLFNILLLVSILSSCEKYPNSGLEILESVNFTLIGNNQFAESGQYATDSVGIQIDMQYLTYSRPGGIIATIEGIEGGGSVDQTLFNLKDDGKILTRWKLGSEANAQKLKITLSDSEGNYLTSAQLNAVSYFLGEWNKIESGYLTGISDMVSDTANHRSMLISGGRPYQSGEKFFQWKLVGENSTSSFTTLEINSNNELFAGTWDGDLYKSSDWGKTWVLFPKPIQNYSGYFQLTITPDDYIWVSRWDYGIRCSKDGGITWQKNKAGLNVEEEMGRVHKLNNGSHIALSQNQLRILQTLDDGITWTPMNTPKYSLACYVTEKNEVIALDQENGYSLFKSVDYGQTYELVKAMSTEYGSWPLDHTFAKFGGYYYVLPPGGGLWKTSNFESTDFEKIGNFTEQQHVYTDFRGTVYAVGLSGKTAYILDAAKN